MVEKLFVKITNDCCMNKGVVATSTLAVEDIRLTLTKTGSVIIHNSEVIFFRKDSFEMQEVVGENNEIYCYMKRK